MALLSLTSIYISILEWERRSRMRVLEHLFINHSLCYLDGSMSCALGGTDIAGVPHVWRTVCWHSLSTHCHGKAVFAGVSLLRTHMPLVGVTRSPVAMVSTSSPLYWITEHIPQKLNLTRGQGNILNSRDAPSHMRPVTLYNLALLFPRVLCTQLLQSTILYFAQTPAPVVGNLK